MEKKKRELKKNKSKVEKQTYKHPLVGRELSGCLVPSFSLPNQLINSTEKHYFSWLAELSAQEKYRKCQLSLLLWSFLFVLHSM